MGYSLSLLAVQCSDPDVALSALDLVRTGQQCEYACEKLTGSVTPNGWYLVVANRCDHPFLRSKVLGHLSQNYRVVACSIEEHVMFSSAEEWLGGTMKRCTPPSHDSMGGGTAMVEVECTIDAVA